MPLMGSVPTRPHDEAVQARIFKALHEVALAASGVLDPAELARLTIEHARTLLGGDTSAAGSSTPAGSAPASGAAGG